MAERLAEVEARLASLQGLSGIVSALRTLSAIRMQQAQAALPGMRAYADVVASALGDALLFLPGVDPSRAHPGRRGVVVFATEHGFVGGLVRELLDALPPQPFELFVVGTRGQLTARERGLAFARGFPMATRTEAVAATAGAVGEELARRFVAGKLASADVIHARQEPGRRRAIVQRRLLPPTTAPVSRRRRPPHAYLPPAQLVEKVMLEFFFAELAHAAMEGFAAESAANLETLESASQAIREKVEELRGRQNRLRQEQITEQILERAEPEV